MRRGCVPCSGAAVAVGAVMRAVTSPRAALIALAAALLAGCGGEPQSPACRQFVACVRALDARDGRQTNTVRFEPQGGCWGGAAGAKLCTDACARGMTWVRRDGNVPGACTEGGAP